MSNAWLNIRFGLHHLIIGEEWPLSVRWSRNEFHRNSPKRVELYRLKLPGVTIK